MGIRRNGYFCNIMKSRNLVPIGTDSRGSCATGLSSHVWIEGTACWTQGWHASALNSYRPISNLSFLSKLVECDITGRFVAHAELHALFPARQSAYRRYHSTETVVVSVLNDVIRAADEGKVTCLVLLDLSSAFDTDVDCRPRHSASRSQTAFSCWKLGAWLHDSAHIWTIEEHRSFVGGLVLVV